MSYPPVYITFDNPDTASLMGLQSTKSTEINPEMSIEDDILTIQLPELRSTPKLGGASDMTGVKIVVRNGEPFVIALYNDINKTLASDCCCGSGCCCCAYRCLCNIL